jgi:hypothetical protein
VAYPVIDRKDGNMKLFYMPKTILSQLADIESMKFAACPAPPMPYDVIIQAKNAGTIDASYTVITSPKQESMTEAEVEQMKALKPIEEVVIRLLERQAGGESEPSVQQAGLAQSAGAGFTHILIQTLPTSSANLLQSRQQPGAISRPKGWLFKCH